MPFRRRSSPSKQASPRLKASLYSIATGRPSPPFPSSSASWKATSRSRSLSARQPTAALILATSGTTATQSRPFAQQPAVLGTSVHEELELTSDDVMFMPARSITPPASTRPAFPAAGRKSRTARKIRRESAIDLMNVEGVTWSMGATPFIYDLLGAMERTGKRPTNCASICNGAPSPERWFTGHGRRASYYVSVRATESCPHVYVPPAYALGWNGKFSGRPFKGIEVRVVDEQGRDVPTGMQGEELSRGPNVFVGYLGNPEQPTKRSARTAGSQAATCARWTIADASESTAGARRSSSEAVRTSAPPKWTKR
ncbi:MAG: AMP-binding protein [Eggerthellaceae bacterium]